MLFYKIRGDDVKENIITSVKKLGYDIYCWTVKFTKPNAKISKNELRFFDCYRNDNILE